MNGFPSSLLLQDTDWLLSRCHVRQQTVEDHYKAQGLLAAADGEPDPESAYAEPDITPRAGDPGDPLLSAPMTEPAGGVVYFSASSPEDMKAVFRVMEVVGHGRDYLAIGSHSKVPIHSRYLDQMWILLSPAAREVFGLADTDLAGNQQLTIEEALLGFVERQIDKWTEPGRLYSPYLDGILGGDGEYAREALAFGFQVEDAFSCIYRIWSRPWVVLK